MERRVLERKRKSSFKAPRKSIHIYCNGEKTEKLYIQSLLADLGIPTTIVKLVASNYNRLSLVKEVSRRLSCDDAPDEVWVIFDVDSLPKGKKSNPSKVKEQVNEACALCTKKKYKYIVSNECFEQWFYIHYKSDTSGHHRDMLAKKLSSIIGDKYDKSTPMYDRLAQKLPDALERAESLCASYHASTPIADRLPYTNVYELVKAMYKRANKEIPPRKEEEKPLKK